MKTGARRSPQAAANGDSRSLGQTIERDAATPTSPPSFDPTQDAKKLDQVDEIVEELWPELEEGVRYLRNR